MSKRLFLLFVLCCATAAAKDPVIKRVLPPPGIEIPERDRARLDKETTDLEREIAAHRKELKNEGVEDELVVGEEGRPEGAYLKSESLNDVEVYVKAVRFALLNNEFYDQKDVGKATSQLKTARERLKQWRADKPEWTTAKGTLVRGYRSFIDGSIQPYGLEIPDDYDPRKPARLMVWLHGRGDKSTDLHFIAEREKKKGEFQLPDTIVLHPFGRQCVAFKFAGETDVFESIDDVMRRYDIEGKPILMGFSMGGAGCWHLAAHYPHKWAVASPGAGFVDVRRYNNIKPEALPPWYERQLWGWYDVPRSTKNLFELPLLSYSGEIDKQKASADIMDEEYAKLGKKLQRVIGKGMPHKYDKPSIAEISKWVETTVAGDPFAPQRKPGAFYWGGPNIDFALQHVQDGVWAIPYAQTDQFRPSSLTGEYALEGKKLIFRLRSENLDAVLFQPGMKAPELMERVQKFPIESVVFEVDGQATTLKHDALFDSTKLWKLDGKWGTTIPTGPRKINAISGPIDSAWFGKTLFVRPTGESKNPKTAAWVEQELKHQQDRWRQLFRGEVPIKNDTAVTEDDLKTCNLVLWGDADSNAIIKKLAEYLPVKWAGDKVVIGGRSYPAATHVVPCVFPRQGAFEEEFPAGTHIVLNSGPTFREGHDKTNSQQTPKLPDWAVVDVTTPPSDTAPGKIVTAGFFDEKWQFVDPDKQKAAWEAAHAK